MYGGRFSALSLLDEPSRVLSPDLHDTNQILPVLRQ
jgi:hypothetical protein